MELDVPQPIPRNPGAVTAWAPNPKKHKAGGDRGRMKGRETGGPPNAVWGPWPKNVKASTTSNQMKPSKIRILVADDHPVVRDGIVSIIEIERDMRVVAQAENGVEAVELAKKLLPDIILLDLRMPRMDGLEANAQIQS